MKYIHLRVFDVPIRVRSPDPYFLSLLQRAYGAFLADVEAPVLDYALGYVGEAPAELQLAGGQALRIGDDYELLYTFEKSITIELQKIRRELLFLHAAALEKDGRAALLIAPSGGGKSTTTWALINRGFDYMSDELAPIDLDTLEVHPYPHALCLKTPPPAPFELPVDIIRTAHTLHVPTAQVPCAPRLQTVPIAAMFFLSYDAAAAAPAVAPISKGEAAAHIYGNALNLLAHSRYGLDAAVNVASRCPSFKLTTAALDETCTLVASVLTDID